MKLKISRTNFLKFSIPIEKIIGKNLNLPILNNFLFKASKGKLKITATNLEVGCEVDIPAKIEKDGDLVIPARTINSAISNLSDDVISFDCNGSNLKLKTSKQAGDIAGTKLRKFSRFLERETGKYFDVKYIMVKSVFIKYYNHHYFNDVYRI